MSSPISAVLDSSVILALILHEPLTVTLSDEFLDASVASSVNLAEVQTKLVAGGYAPERAWNDALNFVGAVEPFTRQQAKDAGSLVSQTKAFGLSLGDRACLALAIELNSPVYTTDQMWINLNLGIPIYILRRPILCAGPTAGLR